MLAKWSIAERRDSKRQTQVRTFRQGLVVLPDKTPERGRFCLLACSSLAISSPAFARGGPGGALGSALEVSLVVAILVGLVSGASCARVLRGIPWKFLAFVSVIVLGAALTFPFAGIFFGIPAMLSCAVFISIFHVVRHGVFRARNVEGNRQDDRSGTSLVFRWVAATYAFWVVVSLANFELLGVLAVPPVAFLSPGSIGRFLPFILPPLAIALLVGVCVTAFVVKSHESSRHAAPFIFNACVLVAFFVSAEVFRHHLMARSLSGHDPENLERSSFLTSVLGYRTYFRGRHGGFEEGGKTYRWSYSEREFVPLSPANPPLELHR
jgi:hypothetical protein